MPIVTLARWVAIAAAAAACISLASPDTPAHALSLPTSSAVAIEAGLPVEQAHACHRGVQRDFHGLRQGRIGWHFHTRSCGRRNVDPPGYRFSPGTDSSQLPPHCTYRCRFIGPVKSCDQICH